MLDLPGEDNAPSPDEYDADPVARPAIIRRGGWALMATPHDAREPF